MQKKSMQSVLLIILCVLSGSTTTNAHLSTNRWLGISALGSMVGGGLGAGAFGLHHHERNKHGNYLTTQEKVVGYLASILAGSALGGGITALASYKFTTAHHVSELNKQVNEVDELVTLAQNDDLIINANHATAVNNAHGHETFKNPRAVDSLSQKGALLKQEIDRLSGIASQIKRTKTNEARYQAEYTTLQIKTTLLLNNARNLHTLISNRVNAIQNMANYANDKNAYTQECARIEKERRERELANAQINKMNADAYHLRKTGEAQEMRGKAEQINAWNNVGKTVGRVFGVANEKIDVTMRHR